MPPEHEDAFENENLELEGGGWTTVTVNGKTSSRGDEIKLKGELELDLRIGAMGEVVG